MTTLVGGVAFVLLASVAYKLIEKALIVLVGLMSVVFVVTALLAGPNPGDLVRGLVVPTLPDGALVTVVALIGTTVVPYNLFLHASSVQEKWPESVPTPDALAESGVDTVVSIALGGMITVAILTAAAAASFGSGTTISDAGTMASQLEPALGPAAKYFFAVGLFGAGISSAVTAPLAAAYATAGALGWSRDLRDSRLRAVWAGVLVVGTVLAALGEEPVTAILSAQAANGMLLPIIAVFLLIVMNRDDLLREHRNGPVGNVLGASVVIVAAGLGMFNILRGVGMIAS